MIKKIKKEKLSDKNMKEKIYSHALGKRGREYSIFRNLAKLNKEQTLQKIVYPKA